MDVVGRRFTVSMLLVVVALLALTSISPASAALGTALSTVLRTTAPAVPVTYAHTAQNPTVTYAHTLHTAQDPTVSHAQTWRTVQNPTVTYVHTWRTTQDLSTTYSHTWDATWSRTSSTASSTTWSRRTHVYPTYTQTEYVPIPIQVPRCDPYDPSCYGYNGYYPTPTQGCDPTNPYCNRYPTPSYPPTQPPITACDPNNPNCNGYSALQTMTAYSSTPQTVVVNQPPPQTVAAYPPVPQTVPIPQPQTQDFTLIAIAIIAAGAAVMLLMSRKPRSTTPIQPGLSSSPAQPRLPFCTHCKKQIPPDSRFCRFCGSPQ